MQDLLVNVARRIEKMEKMMINMMDILKNVNGVAAGVKREDEECIVSAVAISELHCDFKSVNIIANRLME